MEIIDKFKTLNQFLTNRNNEWSVIRDKVFTSMNRYEELGKPEIVGNDVRLYLRMKTSFSIHYIFNIIENSVKISIRKHLQGDIVYTHGYFSVLELSKTDLDELNDMLLNKMYDYVTDLIAEPRNRKINSITDDN